MNKYIFITLIFFINTAIAQQGKNGARVVNTNNTVVNEFTALTANATTGGTSLIVTNSNLNTNGRFTNTLANGDLVMIIQMQGTTIKGGVNDSSWGEILNYNTCGLYEFIEVAATPNATTIALKCPLINNYSAAGKTQVVRVPRYTSLNVAAGASIITDNWNGTTGGIVVAEVVNATTVDGLIDASGKGFRGGAMRTGNAGSISSFATNILNEGAEKGEGIAGYETDYIVYGGRYGRGAPANGGGSGVGYNSSGGGGANAGNLTTWNGKGNPDISDPAWIAAWNLEGAAFSTSSSSGGGRGGYSFSNNNGNALAQGTGHANWNGDRRRNVGGNGGRPMDYTTGRLFLGGGGGAGHVDHSNGTAGSNGGGLIYLLSYSNVSGTGEIRSNGADVGNSSGHGCGDGMGGGGSGGTIVLNATTGVSTALAITANGGRGGNQIMIGNNDAAGGGGGGGGGYVAFTSGTPTISVLAGDNGTTNSVCLTEFPPNGATKGGAGLSSLISVSSFTITSSNTNVCEGNTATLTAAISGIAPPGTTIYWYSDSLGTQVLTNGTSFVTPVLFTTATYYVGNCSCSQLTAVTVAVDPSPLVVVSPPAPICSGSSTQLSASGATHYTWNSSPTLNTTTGAVVIATPVTTSTYTVTGTDNNGCSAEATVSLTVNSLPAVNFTSDDTAGCPGICLQFSNTTSNTNIANWQFGDGNTSSQNNAGNCYTTKGAYSIALTITDSNGCVNTLTRNNYVTIFPVPTAAFSNDPQEPTQLNSTVNFTDLSVQDIVSWDWSFGDVNLSASTIQHPSFKYEDAQCHNVSLTVVNTYGCSDDTEKEICIEEDYTFFIPNTFTPNGDAVNDDFKPSIEGKGINEYTFLIFDRWGNKIYSSSDMNKGWDGKVKDGNTIAQQDVYVWRIDFIDDQDRSYKHIGNVNLIK